MIKIFTDGGSRGNPGPAAAGYVVFDSAGNIREKCGKYIGIATNNDAEYQGVVEALSAVSDPELAFFLDSMLVVNQLNGLWKVKEARIREYITKIRVLEAGRKITYTHIPREKNKEADSLVNETLDRQIQ
ncbi:ribonuclease HI family protein [Candidatus Microgenomates bacterium]|nr:ribonuclease HI family protein [Candidatus Microgenomates bacterium]